MADTKKLNDSESSPNEPFATRTNTDNDFIKVAVERRSVSSRNDTLFEPRIGSVFVYKKYGERILKSVDDRIMTVFFERLKKLQFPQVFEQGFLDLKKENNI